MTATEQYEGLITALEQDPDLDVTLRRGSLFAGEHRFAFLTGTALAVELPSPRADDLIRRDIAKPLEHDRPGQSQWVTVDDPEDWTELAREAHTLAHGHVPGGDS